MVVLTLPMPAVVVGWVVRLMDLLFKIKVARGVEIFHLITFVAALLCVGEAMHLRRSTTASRRVQQRGAAHAAQGLQWRAERTLWIASFTLLVYWMILRIYRGARQPPRVHKANEGGDEEGDGRSKKED